jgi:hypothetical protein
MVCNRRQAIGERTDTQQIDFHVAVGLNDNAPSHIFGIGYSFRFDRLF